MHASTHGTLSTRVLHGVVNIGGLLCVVAAIVLSWPGPRWVRADEPGHHEPLMSVQPHAADHAPATDMSLANEPPAAAACTPGKTDAAPMLVVEQQRAVERVRARIRAQAAPAPEVMVLNGRGYNYGPGPSDTPRAEAALQRELAEQRK